MKKSIKLRKPILVEGKIISKGARIIVESEDIEDVGQTMNPSEDINYDVIKAKRLAKLRKIRAMKKLEGDDEVVSTEDNLKPEDFPADEIQALRRARLARIRKIKAMKKAEDDLEEDEDEIAEKKAKRLARIKKIRAMKKAEGETVSASENDEPMDFPADEIQALRKARLARIRKAKKAEDELEEESEEVVDITQDDEGEKMALRKARLARIRKIRNAKKAEDEVTEEDELNEEDEPSVCDEKCK